MDSQLGESGYSLGRGEAIGGRATLQRIPEEGSSDGGPAGPWSQPSWPPLMKEQSKKEKAEEEVLIRPGELSNRPDEFTKRPENIPVVESDQPKISEPTVCEVGQEEEVAELGISHLILHTKETFIA